MGWLFPDSVERARLCTAEHEFSHVVVAEHFGATDLKVHVADNGDGGWFTGWVDDSISAESEAIILMAGGSTGFQPGLEKVLPRGNMSDVDQARLLLRGSEMTVADARREANRLVRANQGQIRRRARRFVRNGRV
jgi:hypothetical protein